MLFVVGVGGRVFKDGNGVNESAWALGVEFVSSLVS